MAEPIITRIYALVDEDGNKRYVGKTVQRLSQRLADHFEDAKRGDLNHRCHWLREQRSLGRKVRIELLEEFVGSNWSERERWWIRHGREQGWKLTNNTDGGEGSLGHRHRPETKAKIAALRRANPSRMSPEKREELRQRMKGNTFTLGYRATAETRAKLSKIHKGRKHSPETIAKRSASKTGVSVGKGVPKPEGFGAKLRAFYATPEGRAKLAGRHTEERRKNAAEKMRLWWATSPKADACREQSRQLCRKIARKPGFKVRPKSAGDRAASTTLPPTPRPPVQENRP